MFSVNATIILPECRTTNLCYTHQGRLVLLFSIRTSQSVSHNSALVFQSVPNFLGFTSGHEPELTSVEAVVVTSILLQTVQKLSRQEVLSRYA